MNSSPHQNVKLKFNTGSHDLENYNFYQISNICYNRKVYSDLGVLNEIVDITTFAI